MVEMHNEAQRISSSYPLPWALIALVFLITTFFIHYPNRYIFTRDRPDIPGPKGQPILGNTLEVARNIGRILEWMDQNLEKYGPLWSFTMPGWGRSIMVNHPVWLDYIRKQDTQVYTKGSFVIPIFQGFPGPNNPLATDGAEWRSHRRLMAPIFAMKNFDQSVSNSQRKILPIACNLLISAGRTDTVLDWNKFSSRLSIMLFVQTAFNVNTNGLTANLSCLERPDEIGNLLETLNVISANRLFSPTWSWSEKLTGVRHLFESTKARLHAICDKMIVDRQRLLREPRSASKDELESDTSDFLSALMTSGLGTEQMRDILIMLIFAGNDNTVNALGWSLDFLSKDRAAGGLWMQRMRSEAMERGGEIGEIMEYKDINNYPVHLAIFYETLRLRPGVPKNARYVEQNDILPRLPEAGYPNGVKVFKGEYVTWSDIAMMRDPEIWGPDAREFNPSRFLDASGKFVKPPSPKFHAFGQGPRSCPGSTLATYQFIAIWSSFLPFVDIEPLNVHEERRMSEAFTSNMESDFKVRIKLVS